MFPDTPGVRKWWEDGIREDILRKPQQTYLKVIDTNAHGRMVAYAKWDLGSMEERGPRALPFDREEMDREACGEFYAHMDRERKRLMGDRKHYCISLLSLCFLPLMASPDLANKSMTATVLDMLATHPDYQGQGAGSMLVRWGCALADKDGVPAYVDASKAGKPLYEKFGFVDRSETQRQGEGIEVAMVRETGHNHSG